MHHGPFMGRSSGGVASVSNLHNNLPIFAAPQTSMTQPLQDWLGPLSELERKLAAEGQD